MAQQCISPSAALIMNTVYRSCSVRKRRANWKINKKTCDRILREEGTAGFVLC